jgi:hypothetical protein
MIKTTLATVLLATAPRACADVPPPPGPRPAVVNPAAANPAPAISASSTIPQVLDALCVRGKTLTSFTADLAIQDINMDQDMGVTRTGRIWYQTGPAGMQMHLMLDKKTKSNQVFIEKREYLLDGVWLTDRDYTGKNETVRQIAPVGKQVDLFQLGNGGPFPLPIGQPTAAVLKAFNVTKLDPAKDDPANTVHLKLKPLPNTELADQFSEVEVWVDFATQMPVRIETVDKNRTVDKIAYLKNLQVNPAMNPADFQLGKIDGTWKKSTIPLNQ